MLIRSLVWCFLMLCGCLAVYGGDTKQGIFHPDFKTLSLSVNGDCFATPIVTIGDTAARLEISFDELSDTHRYLRYSLTHCGVDWKPDGLVDSEYLYGFNEGIIEDYSFSEATLVHYVHYKITFPDEQMRITQPGNYLLKVCDEDEPDDIILQVRFMVVDPQTSIRMDVSSRTDIDVNKSHQQVSIAIDTRNLKIDNPFGDLKVVVTQNGRLDNQVTLTSPQRVEGSTLIYEHLPKLIFDAGNEYRRFETVATTYTGIGVNEIAYGADGYEFILDTDRPRKWSPYVYDQTQHGGFIVREESALDSDVQADYVTVKFSLEMPELREMDVVIDGDFLRRRMNPESTMEYNRVSGRYEKDMLLKQGSYNYQYLTVLRDNTEGYTGNIEGDFYQTNNRYDVRVYHRPQGGRFDCLVGFQEVTTE
ncbi:MAG: DUF5103 domain-containing protein [Muribaculum sp.]|nr:DUF5103 domain-containing protein [Muribaculum sp.]